MRKYKPDIVIPSLNLIIEYNGLYWHSTEQKDNDYHIRKTLAYNKMGYQTIHIWEDEWLYEQDKIKKWLRYVLGVDKRQPRNFGRNKENEFDLCWWPIPKNKKIIKPKMRIKQRTMGQKKASYKIYDCGSYK